MTRIYLSNIKDEWPIGRQEELLDHRLPDWRSMAAYYDVLPKSGIKTGRLVQRDDFLLRKTGRTTSGGDVVVAALPVLARTPTDLTAVLVRLAARHETLRSLAEDVLVDPTSEDLDDIRAAFTGAARRFSAKGVPGGVASGIKRSAEAQAKVELIRPFWPLLEPTTNELCETFDISRPTVESYLGPRKEAQREYQRELHRQMHAMKVAEANRRRKKRDAE